MKVICHNAEIDKKGLTKKRDKTNQDQIVVGLFCLFCFGFFLTIPTNNLGYSKIKMIIWVLISANSMLIIICL